MNDAIPPGAQSPDDEKIRQFQKAAEKEIPKNVSNDASSDTIIAEARWYNAQALHAEIKTARWKQDIELRRLYAEKAFDLAGWAVWFWIIMFAAVGIANGAMGKPILSDTGLITLTSGATVNVIAICVVVVRGLFPTSIADKEH